jgi:hypothetical protein
LLETFTLLENGDVFADGYVFTLRLADDDFRLEATPGAPGVTGSRRFEASSDGEVTESVAPGSDEGRGAMLRELHQIGLETVAGLLWEGGEPETARSVIPCVQNTEVVRRAFDAWDGNRDGVVTPRELCRAASPNPEEPPWSPANVSARICAAMQLGRWGERLDGRPGVAWEEVAENDPASLFSFANVCELAGAYVVSPDVAHSLCAKLDAAASSEAREDIGARDNQLRAFQQEVEAQRGKAFSDAEGDVLHVLAEVLKSLDD